MLYAQLVCLKCSSTMTNLSSIHFEARVIIKVLFSFFHCKSFDLCEIKYQMFIHYFYMKNSASSKKYKSSFVKFKLYLSQLLSEPIALYSLKVAKYCQATKCPFSLRQPRESIICATC